MRAVRLAPLLLLLVLAPRVGRAQAAETPSEDGSWNAFPEGAAPTPVVEEPFEPIDFPGQTAAPDTAMDAAPARDIGPASEPPAPEGDFSREASSPLSLIPSPSASGPSPRLTPEPLAVPLVRSLLDLAGASALTLSSAVAMDALVGTRCFRDTERMCILTSFLVTMLSVSATAPVGAWAVGSLLGGEGKLWAAYLGAAMGMGLGVIGTMPTIAFGSGVILAVAGPIGAAVGAVIGYEVSHRSVVRGASRFAQRPAGLRVSPLVATTQGGSLLGGMMGTF
ncbi:hypothetical protein [Pyxidicoccus sp. MSG2]|uniref:hypothetical protein n=1 Tax=Pyxidicoccus sp. MSG2 TaxID=2996790 RepID=UPI00226E0373|nr:hypothetical protein [Pyxidicoccus sp. MSG2]MCY1020280.1 hypothetical protein [Pyxidicoccus sp. MSG2]